MSTRKHEWPCLYYRGPGQADHEERTAVAVQVITAGHSAEHHNGVVHGPDVERRQLLFVTRDRIPHAGERQKSIGDDGGLWGRAKSDVSLGPGSSTKSACLLVGLQYFRGQAHY
jgi:hypothetical protein